MQDKLQTLSQSCDRYHYNLFAYEMFSFWRLFSPLSLRGQAECLVSALAGRRVAGADQEETEGCQSREKAAHTLGAACLFQLLQLS